MKNIRSKMITVCTAMAGLSACATNHDSQAGFLLGAATDRNVATQSIRAADVPNSNGLTGQSGERAVAAIDRLNSGEKPDLSGAAISPVGN